MNAYCLASSSLGNCYVLELEVEGVPTRIMIECGIPLKEIYKRSSGYGIDLSTIKCCLITHAHGDHSKAAKDMIRLCIPVYAHKDTLSHLNIKGNELIELKPIEVCKGIKVMAFPVEHDIEGSVGFVIKTKDECVIFVNDHKRWTVNLSNFKPNYIFIECNYDQRVVYAQVGELNKLKKTAPSGSQEAKEINIKLAQHKRNLESHCGLRGAIKGLQKLNLKECRSIFLMHLSDRFANEYRMKNEVQLATGIKTFVCGKLGGGIR